MPIVSNVEAKSLRGRLIHLTVFVILLLGGITMVYPFLIMVSGSVRSEVDESELTLVPRYLMDSDWLYRKFLETKYNQEVISLIQAHGRPYYSFGQVDPPTLTASSAEAIADLRAFMSSPGLPLHWQRLGGIRGYETVPENLREFRERLQHRFDGDLNALSQSLGTPVSSWLNVVLPRFNWLGPRFDPEDDVLFATYVEMLEEASPGDRQLVSLSGEFLTGVIFPVYGQSDTEEYNRAHVKDLTDYAAFNLPRTLPDEDQPRLRAEWMEFVRDVLNPVFIGLREPDPRAYRAFLRQRYPSVAGLAQTWGQPVQSIDAIDLPQGRWLSGQARLDYAAYLEQLPPEALELVGPEYAYRDWLMEKYGSIDRLNARYGTSYAGFTEVGLPMAALEFAHVLENAGDLRWAFITRNYINVFNELVFQGGPLFNTLVFVTLCVVLALLINPLAAYAMSRFNLPGTYKVLLLMMATTAFPPMVTLIPQFIVLREMHLLNTMVALVLPFMVNGYMVFLLKGFFDSLPQELYQAGRIDGASEARMFFQITMALSKPILAVLGLQVFTAAYTAFLYPLLVAPGEDMWLISVWLYQFQQRSSSSAVYASVIIASIPTLAVFLFAQRTIMRGIVVPTEK